MATSGSLANTNRLSDITILIVTPTRCYGEALAQILQDSFREGVAAVDTAREAITRAHEFNPGVILIDLPPELAVALTGSLKQLRPQAKLIALSVPASGSKILAWARAGVNACLTRDTALADLPFLIEQVASGSFVSSPAVAGLVFEHLCAVQIQDPRPADSQLTQRETEILRLVAQGLSNKEIARTLSIQLPTVKNHRQNVYDKLGTRRRAEAAAWFQNGHRVPIAGPG